MSQLAYVSECDEQPTSQVGRYLGRCIQMLGQWRHNKRKIAGSRAESEVIDLEYLHS